MQPNPTQPNTMQSNQSQSNPIEPKLIQPILVKQVHDAQYYDPGNSRPSFYIKIIFSYNEWTNHKHTDLPEKPHSSSPGDAICQIGLGELSTQSNPIKPKRTNPNLMIQVHVAQHYDSGNVCLLSYI